MHENQPNARGKVCAARRRARCIGGQLGAPDRALVAEKGADPVPGPLAQHGVAVFAARDEEEGAVLLDRGKGEMSDWAGVARCDEGFRRGPGTGERGTGRGNRRTLDRARMGGLEIVVVVIRGDLSDFFVIRGALRTTVRERMLWPSNIR